jgi:hypothetical protein
MIGGHVRHGTKTTPGDAPGVVKRTPNVGRKESSGGQGRARLRLLGSLARSVALVHRIEAESL